jgi:DNA-binding transcriptional ArsR family regulator
VAQYSAQLDGVFVALADPTRRAVIRRLGGGPSSVGELSREFAMTLPSFMCKLEVTISTRHTWLLGNGVTAVALAAGLVELRPWRRHGDGRGADEFRPRRRSVFA